MLKIDQNKAQAVVELAVFGAILIYIIGTIIRTAVGNSLTQNENFKAMRLAMLESWQGSIVSNISRNSASVIVLEDRLSPEYGKYGTLDRTPYMANGSGTFSYELLYPLTPGADNMQAQMPIMDVFINGQHFTFSTSYYVYRTLLNPDDGYQVAPGYQNCPLGNNTPPIVKQTLSKEECLHNQCLRYIREWVGGRIYASQFDNVISPVNVVDPTCTGLGTAKQQNLCQANLNGLAIFDMLAQSPGALIDQIGGNASSVGKIDPAYVTAGTSSTAWSAFMVRYRGWFSTYFPQLTSPPYTQAQINARVAQSTPAAVNAQLVNIKKVLDSVPPYAYKLFYTFVANMLIPGAAEAAPVYTVNAPTCASHPCQNQELSSDRCLADPSATLCNNNGDLLFDLQRNNIPSGQPGSSIVPSALRPYMAWEWTATAGTTAAMIGLVTSNGQFPQYDIDGRMKEVTIYSISGPNAKGEPTLSY